MAGAFGSGRQDASIGRAGRPQDDPQDALSSFTAKLEQVYGGTGGLTRPAHTQDAPRTPPGRSPDPIRSTELSAMDKLASMLKSRTLRTPGQVTHPAPKTPVLPKGEFVPGQKPVPTGPTAHEIMTHPAHQDALKAVLAEHEKVNPGRSLKAPTLMNLWNAKNPGKPLNEARARTVVAKVNKARDSYVQKQVQAYMRNGAKKAVT